MVIVPGRGQVRFFLLGGALALAGGPVRAADQGEIGASSRGSVMITASVAYRSVASGVSDIALSEVSSAQSVCLWSSGSTRGFGLAASGDGPQGALVVDDAAGDAVPYAVEWNGAPLTAGSPRKGLTAAATQPGCGNGGTGRSNLKVRFAAAAPNHKGTLTLLVIPQ